MAHFHVKKKNGRPYLYVREIARVDGRPKVISQVYIGSPDKVAAMAKGELKDDLRLKVQQFGALWLSFLMDQDMDLAGIIDSVVPRGPREKGPTVGEFFLYSVWNRMSDAVSKRKLAGWYERTAVQQLRPVDLKQLTSEQYWRKWDRVTEDQLAEISRRFFTKLCELESPDADCVLFDTTNYYTFMASQTDSSLAARGHNKAGRHNLRQVGLGLLVARKSRLPLFYREYQGNLHDSQMFASVMQEMFEAVGNLQKTKERLTVVVDKGMNSEDNFLWLDDNPRMHFVTTYSPHYVEELMSVPFDHFEPVSIEHNERLTQAGCPQEQMLATRTHGEFWGKERTVVVTYNPPTARKHAYTLERKLEEIREELLIMRTKVRQEAPHWRDADTIAERYFRLCENKHIRSDLFELEFTEEDGLLVMGFRKNAYRVGQQQDRFGKTVIVTDNMDWTTADIVSASLDRWQVEEQFRQSKNDDLVGVQPIRHWTDSKIRCHMFTCVVALTNLRRLELRLASAGVNRTAVDVMDDMCHLHSVLLLPAGAKKPRRRLETPSKTQTEVLLALGWRVNAGGVLQEIER